jgi:hypothetical protein
VYPKALTGAPDRRIESDELWQPGNLTSAASPPPPGPDPIHLPNLICSQPQSGRLAQANSNEREFDGHLCDYHYVGGDWGCRKESSVKLMGDHQ